MLPRKAFIFSGVILGLVIIYGFYEIFYCEGCIRWYLLILWFTNNILFILLTPTEEKDYA